MITRQGKTRYCKSRGALIIGITNTVGSTICRESHCGVHINAGPEIGVASTKAYTSQILSLTMFALVMAEDRISLQPRYVPMYLNCIAFSSVTDPVTLIQCIQDCISGAGKIGTGSVTPLLINLNFVLFRRSEIIQGLKALPDQIRKVLELDGKVLEIARELFEKKSLLIMGRGYNFATCLEGALKVGLIPLMEIRQKILNYFQR